MRYIGIGAIFVAGLIGILRLSPVIVRSLSRGFRDFMASRKAHSSEVSAARTDRDLSMSFVVAATLLVIAVIWIYFRFSVLGGLPNAGLLSLIALAVTVIISFLFASVSATAVAMIGVRYAAIIFAGSMLSWFVFVPLFAHLQSAGGAAA
ncbi:MAG: hypothetical protein B6D63_07090, partial [Candidatus Latescibacteria bacterium 4484_7]